MFKRSDTRCALLDDERLLGAHVEQVDGRHPARADRLDPHTCEVICWPPVKETVRAYGVPLRDSKLADTWMSYGKM